MLVGRVVGRIITVGMAFPDILATMGLGDTVVGRMDGAVVVPVGLSVEPLLARLLLFELDTTAGSLDALETPSVA
jgi:hypothetical protein